MTLVPSGLRTVALGTYLGLAPRGRQPTPAPLRWPNKGAGETLDFSIDASVLLMDAGGDTINLVSPPAILPNDYGGLSPVSQSFSGGVVTFWFNQGITGEDYTVTATIVLASGRVLSPVVRLYVSAAPSALPVCAPGAETSNYFVTADGDLLTDAGGNPLTTID
jgi:hypothetical protein